MIFDRLTNAGDYSKLYPDIHSVLQVAACITAETYPTEPVYLDEDRVFINVPTYTTHAREDAVMEAHRQYVDVFVMVEGCEVVYVKNTDTLRCITQQYNASDDALLAECDGDASAIRMEPGTFLILFPQDAHAPACYADSACAVKKLIGKVRIR